MFSSGISSGRTLVPIMALALVLALVEGCSGPVSAVAPAAVPTVPTTTIPPTPAPTTTNRPEPSSTSVPTLTQTSIPDPETEYPLALGDTWVYRRTGYEAVPITEFITTTLVITETVVEVEKTSAYFAARIHREESAEAPVFVAKDRQGEPLRPATSSEYWLVVIGNQTFRSANLGQPNLGKTDSREFVFPLHLGDKWYLYEASDPGVPGGVSGLSREVLKVGPVQVPAGGFDDCFLIKDDWATDAVENWFCPGVGWVDLKMDHKGTPVGSRQVLVSYHFSTLASDSRLAQIRQGAPYAILVPTKLPTGLVPDPPVRSDSPNDNVQIKYRDAFGHVALLVLNGPAGCCLDADRTKTDESIVLPNGITAHLLEYIQPEYGGPILWWIQDQTYVALSSPRLGKQDLIDVATSMSKAANIP